ncbi:type IV pilus biogenesis protein EbsA [Trichothermofontia sp.]
MPINQPKAAAPEQVMIYQPYYQGSRRNALPYAISLYQEGSLEGERRIEGGESIPFIASWEVTSLPLQMTRCRVQFDGKADLSYQTSMKSHELIDFLIDAFVHYRRNQVADFPPAFYRKLLNMET